MKFRAQEYARMLEMAVPIKDSILDTVEEKLGKKPTEEEAVAFFTAMSILCKLSAQVTRSLSGRTPDEIKKLLKDDCTSLKVLLETVKPEFVTVLKQEMKSDAIADFLAEVEFFEYPDALIEKWDQDLQPRTMLS